MPKESLNKVYHVINIPEKEQRFLTEFLEDVSDKVKEIVTIKAVGRASAGLLSNPANGVIILAGILGVAGGIWGPGAIENLTKYFEGLQGILTAETREEKGQAGRDVLNSMTSFLRTFFPIGTPPPV